MIKTKTFSARYMATLVVLLVLLVPLVLSACGGGEPTEIAVAPTTAPTEPPAPTDVPTEPPAPTDVPTEPPPTDIPTEPPPPTDVPEPTETPEPTAEPTPEVLDDTACIGCHTDEETLKLVAEEEEKPEVESEGEG
jgi:outer membrane biosynthesis protein TonB